MKEKIVKMKWRNAALVMEVIGEEVNREEGFFICPICEEPILEEDYREVPAEVDEKFIPHPFCPICGSFFE